MLLVLKFHRLTKALKLLIGFLTLSFLFDLACYFLAKNHQNTHPLFHVFTWIECLFFLYFFLDNIKTDRFRKIVWLNGAIAAVACIYNTGIDPHLQQLNNISDFVKGIMLCINCLMLFQILLNNVAQQSTCEKALYWINLSFLVYGALPLFMYLFYYAMANNVNFTNTIYALYLVVTICFHGILGFGIWKYNTNK
jgi:hypothetical protein